MPWLSMKTKPILTIYDRRSDPESKEGFLSFWKCLCLPRHFESDISMLNRPELYGSLSSCMESKTGSCHLEWFQGEVAKRILQMPKWYPNKVACIAPGLNSIQSVCTIRKSKFLHQVMTNEESICYWVYSAMVDDVETLRLVHECREWKERYESNFTTQVLEVKEYLDGPCVLKETEKYISEKDQTLLLAKVL